MTETQKLREALQAISHIDDTTNHSVDASAALDRIGQIARQALALPTKAEPAAQDHIPDAGGMVGAELPELPAQTHFPGWAPIPYYTADQMREYARAALSAQAVPNPWRDAVIEQLECWHIYVPAIHDNSPRLAIKALVNIETQAALDPKVSSQAAALAVPDERDKVDAERYRWLTDGKRGDWVWNHVLTEEVKGDHSYIECAIDAAMRKEKP